MGDKFRTQQNLEVVGTDAARGLIFVKGSVPGSKGGWLFVKDAIKHPRHEGAPFPAALLTANEDLEPHVMEVEDGAVHDIPALPSAEEVEAGVAASDAAGAGDVDPGSVPPADTTPGQEG